MLGKDLSFERAERLRFEGLFRNNPAAMAIHSVGDGRCVDANEAYLRVFGYSRDEVVGQPGPELHMFADDPERWSQAKEELLTTGAMRNRELTFRRKDGRVVHGLFSGDILTSQGQMYALTVMIDVTEESQLQVALTAERNRLANIIDGTRLGTWEWNLQTGATTYNERWADNIAATTDINFTVDAEIISTDSLQGGDGWVSLYNGTSRSDNENMNGWVYAAARTNFKRWEGDPDPERLNIKSSRKYRISSGGLFTGSMGYWYTYNDINYTVSGTCSGYSGDGSGIGVDIYRVVSTTQDEMILSLTTTSGGIFSGKWVDNTDTLYAAARQDDTHVGRSSNGVAG